jgi:hypothetical protein
MSTSTYSLPDSLSIGAIIFAGVSGCFMFIKTIKKCRISRKGLELERELDKEKDLASQQEFMLNLIKVVQKENLQHEKPQQVRRCASDDSLPWNKSRLNVVAKDHHTFLVDQHKIKQLPPPPELNPKLQI